MDDRWALRSDAKWKPRFKAHEEEVKSMAVWLRIVKPSLEVMNIEFLTQVGNGVGSTIKVDTNTYHQTRVFFFWLEYMFKSI